MSDLALRELTAEDIFSADDTTTYPLEIPEWKKNGQAGILYVKSMTGAESIAFQESLKNQEQRKSLFVRMLAQSACDSKGNLLFKMGDLEKLRQKNVAIFMRLQKFLLEINGMVGKEKTWETVQEILSECNIDGAVIALVKTKWDADDPVTVVKND